MKPSCLILFALFAASSFTFAPQTILVPDVGVSLRIPDDWKQNENDKFGIVICPATEEKKKIRIHLTAHKGMPAKEAVQRCLDKINEARIAKGQAPEAIISSTPITTRTGIAGQKAIFGQQDDLATAYLNRYYFERPDGRLFCVCVYHYGDLKFSADAERMIITGLTLKK